MTTARLDLLQGTLDVLILKTLAWGPMHGYAVTNRIKEHTDAAILIAEGALYPALHRLEKSGWVESEWGVSENNRKAKYDTLTPAGRAQLRAEVTAWNRYVEAVGKVLARA